MDKLITHITFPKERFFRDDFPFAIQKTVNNSYDVNTGYRFNRMFWKISYIISGTGYHVVGDQKFVLKPNSLIVTHPDADTTTDINGDCLELYNLVFDPSFLGHELDHIADPANMLNIFTATYSRKFESPLFCLTATREIAALIRSIHQEYNERNTNWQILVRLRFIELLLLIVRRTENKGHRNPEWTANYVREYLQKNFSGDVSVQQLAQELRISPERLSRLYREYFGSGIIEDLKGFRLRHAGEQLSGTMLSITEIIRASGFNDPVYFYRCFHKAYHTTPERFRQNKLDKNDK
ncbi:MAG: helix-turn-helix domain-containing protein [Lentisphaeria bacterium]|nr:helix-turn-helix domain-containing protein [Lentisphaeria bacterium]